MVPCVNDAVFFEQGVFATTPMVYDVLAIQHLYGANTTHNAGNTTYAFNDHDLFYECVWDAGGIDTFDASDTERRVILDLNEGQFSSIGTSPSGLGEDAEDAEDNVAIAFGVTIENGKDGLAGDTLWGNGGGDSLVGRGGNDVLSGGSGLNHMDGGKGDDELRVDETGARVIERSNGGRDTVRTSADFTLPNHVEVLRLIVADAINGSGNDGTNTIVGNLRANLIDGGDSDDHMIGLGSDDTYVVRQAGDDVVEATDGGFDTILSHITTTIADNVEMVVLAGNRRIDATGAAGDDILQGNRSANDLSGGGGRDVLIGGGGGDTFRYLKPTDGSFVADNVTRGSIAGDRIVDFATGVDRFRFDAAAFDPDGALGPGLLTQGVDFSIIAAQYNGTNAGANANHAACAALFVFSTAARTLYFDADGAAAGHTVVATLDAGAVAATNIKIG